MSRPTLALRALALPLALVLALALGCSDPETGVLVSVRSTDSTEVEGLVLLAGRAAPATFSFAGDVATLNDAEGGQVISFPARDLAADPFTVLLRDGGSGESFRLGALAGHGSEGARLPTTGALGALDEELVFVDGEVLEWELTISPDGGERLAPPFSPGAECVLFGDDDGGLLATLGDDFDCDGFSPPVDCSDHDGFISPARPEICDGRPDNDCNSATSTYGDLAPCFFENEGTCRLGSTGCADEGGGGPGSVCEDVGDEILEPELCDAYRDCVEGREPSVECVYDKLEIQTVICHPQIVRGEPTTAACPGRGPISASEGDDECIYRVHVPLGASIPVSLARDQEGGVQLVGCDELDLVFAGGDNEVEPGAPAFEVLVSVQVGGDTGYVRVAVTPETVDACEPDEDESVCDRVIGF